MYRRGASDRGRRGQRRGIHRRRCQWMRPKHPPLIPKQRRRRRHCRKRWCIRFSPPPHCSRVSLLMLLSLLPLFFCLLEEARSPLPCIMHHLPRQPFHRLPYPMHGRGKEHMLVHRPLYSRRNARSQCHPGRIITEPMSLTCPLSHPSATVIALIQQEVHQ